MAALSMTSSLAGARLTQSKRSVRASAPARTVVVASADRVSVGQKVAAGLAAVSLASALPAFADIGAALKLPPLDPDPNRCEKGFTGNTIGQSNGVSDKVLDMRFCVYDGKKLEGTTYGGSLMSDASYKGASFKESVFTKVYAGKSDFTDADLTNVVIDRSVFAGANFTNAKFINAVITGTDFTDAILTGADFEDSLVGSEDVKRLCANPTLVDDSRYQVGCRE